MKASIRALTLLSAFALVSGCGTALPPSDGATGSADAKLVARGARLAAVGNCRGCHTRYGGPAYAGGFPMHSPFGTLYSTNITPDPDTGIGRWSLEAFRRAMREGVRADGAHLYPAFPYDRFTRTSDEDIAALYAFVMSLPPVRHEAPENELAFPFNIRAGIGVWKALHFRKRGPVAHASRGEYLVEGLGHCGSCHSPRTKLFAEDLERVYDGGEAEGWHAYAINEKNAAPVPWDAQALAFYLRNGYHPHHGIARGTMGLVTDDLRHAAPEDVEAMAAYVASLMKAPTSERRARGEAVLRGPDPPIHDGSHPAARLYETTCAGCHRGRHPLPWDGLPLALSTGLTGESPRNLVNVILHGLPAAPGGETTAVMPGYLGALDDAQVEALVHWMRANLTDRPPWKDVAKHIAESRKMKPDMMLFPPGGTGSDVARTAPRDARSPDPDKAARE